MDDHARRQLQVAEYPAREARREAAAKEAAEKARVEQLKNKWGGEAGLAALEASGVDTKAMLEAKSAVVVVHETLDATLKAGGLEHLVSVLKADGRSIDEWCALFMASGRTETIKSLKQAGVEKLGDRQKLASLIGKIKSANEGVS